VKKSEKKAFDAELAHVRERADLQRRKAELLESLGNADAAERYRGYERRHRDDEQKMLAWAENHR
jgi:hypothetical protein